MTSAYWRLFSQGLVARSDGGVRLLFNGGPDEASEDTIPVIVSYDADLRPDGDPVLLAEEPGEAEAGLVHGSTGGTVFAALTTASGGEIVAVPDGSGGATVLVRSSDVDYLEDLAVDPGQTWLTVPLQWGAAAVDLTSGEVTEPVDTGCREGQGVRWVFPGHDGAALLLGECEGAETLWIVGA